MSEPLTKERLEEIREEAEAEIQNPWHLLPYMPAPVCLELIAEVERLRGILGEVELATSSAAYQLGMREEREPNPWGELHPADVLSKWIFRTYNERVMTLEATKEDLKRGLSIARCVVDILGKDIRALQADVARLKGRNEYLEARHDAYQGELRSSQYYLNQKKLAQLADGRSLADVGFCQGSSYIGREVPDQEQISELAEEVDQLKGQTVEGILKSVSDAMCFVADTDTQGRALVLPLGHLSKETEQAIATALKDAFLRGEHQRGSR